MSLIYFIEADITEICHTRVSLVLRRHEKNIPQKCIYEGNSVFHRSIEIGVLMVSENMRFVNKVT